METDALLVAAPAALTAHRRSLKALTGIRFLAAFYVVVYHTRLSTSLLEHGHRIPAWFLGKGYMAVPLFFLLSGFILAYTYEGQIEKPGDTRRFLEARFARIWPAYALSLVLCALLQRPWPGLGTAVATAFMVQGWNPMDIQLAGAINLVCWTLTTEALFYVIFPSAQLKVEARSERWQLGFTGAMLLLCVVTNSGPRGLGYHPVGAWRWIPLPVCHVPEFLAGVGVGNYFLRRLSVTTVRPLTVLLRGGGAWTYVAAFFSVALLCTPNGWWSSLVVPTFCALIYGLAAEKTAFSRFLSTPAMILAGGISYSVYLFQLPVKIAIQMFADRIHLASQTVRMGLLLPVLLVLSYVVFTWVEEPSRKLIRGGFAKIEARRTRADVVAG